MNDDDFLDPTTSGRPGQRWNGEEWEPVLLAQRTGHKVLVSRLGVGLMGTDTPEPGDILVWVLRA